MQAIRYNEPWSIELVDVPAPIIEYGNQVLVKIYATGICGTDLGIVSGEYHANPGIVLGHESSGVVEQIGADVTSLRPGDRVAIDPTYYCGFCRHCRSSRQNHCKEKSRTEAGVSRNGTFAEYYLTEERFVYRIPDSLSFESASLSEPLSCVLTGVNSLRVRSDLSVIVLGAGPIGILYASVLQSKGLTGTIVETADYRAEVAVSMLPFWTVHRDLKQAVKQLVSEVGGIDIVVDTTASADPEAISCLDRGGQFLSVGLRSRRVAVDLGEFADRSLSVQGSIDSLGTFSVACQLLATRTIPGDQIVTHRFSLEQYGDALQLLACDRDRRETQSNAKALKVVLVQE